MTVTVLEKLAVLLIILPFLSFVWNTAFTVSFTFPPFKNVTFPFVSAYAMDLVADAYVTDFKV